MSAREHRESKRSRGASNGVLTGRLLGVRPPGFVDPLPEQARVQLEALRALYRDHIERTLDSRPRMSVDVPDADPPEED